MTVIKRIGLGFGVVFFLILALTFVAKYANHILKQNMDVVIEDASPLVLFTSDLIKDLLRQDKLLYTLSVSDSEAELARQWKYYQSISENLELNHQGFLDKISVLDKVHHPKALENTLANLKKNSTELRELISNLILHKHNIQKSKKEYDSIVFDLIIAAIF